MKKVVTAVAVVAITVVVLTAGALVPQAPAAGVLVPTSVAQLDIPGVMLALYQQAVAVRCPGLSWA
ncbi:MAG: hydrolase Nlp/P60, partial [Nitriliruptorales bacterium]|nr:hydrolase Nlp/P60 [Nitriliruptorales bacterium]